MKYRCLTTLSSILVTTIVLVLPACTSSSTAQQDEQAREKVANATQKAKEESEKAAQQLDTVARQAEHEAHVAAQGVQEGWKRDQKGALDLNSATKAELRRLPGMDRSEADRIVDGRPYKYREELVSRGILSQSEYDGIEDRIKVEETVAGKR